MENDNSGIESSMGVVFVPVEPRMYEAGVKPLIGLPPDNEVYKAVMMVAIALQAEYVKSAIENAGKDSGPVFLQQAAGIAAFMRRVNRTRKGEEVKDSEIG